MAALSLVRDTASSMTERPTMPDPVERVRFMLGEAGNRADFDAILNHYAADALWIMPTQEFRGVDAIRRHWEEWYENYEEFRLDAPHVVDIGNGVVLAILHQGGRLRGSGAELRQQLALIYEWSNGQVVRVTASAAQDDIDEARAAAERLAKVRAAFAQFNSGEREVSPDALDPAVEISSRFARLDGRPYRGVDGFREWLSEIDQQFDVWETTLTEVRDLGHERVLTLGSIHARGRASRVTLDLPLAAVHEFRGGRLRRMIVRDSKEQVLKDAAEE